MRYELTPDTLSEFQSQFHALNDTIIESFYLEAGKRDFSVVIKCTSLKSTETEWARYNLIFQLDEVADIRLIRNPIAAIDVVLDARIEFFESNIVINFHPTTFKSDIMTSIHKDSQFLVVAKRCYWEATKIESK